MSHQSASSAFVERMIAEGRFTPAARDMHVLAALAAWPDIASDSITATLAGSEPITGRIEITEDQAVISTETRAVLLAKRGLSETYLDVNPSLLLLTAA